MIASVAVNGGLDDATVHLMHDGSLSPTALDDVRAMGDRLAVRVEFLTVPDAALDGLPTAGFTGKGSWYRVFLPRLLPDVDRLLYLDVDLLVLDSVAPLFEVDLAGTYVGAVKNVWEHDQTKRLRALGVHDPTRYFNAGVLAMDLRTMREDCVLEQLIDFGMRRADDLVLPDQDSLNVVLADRWTELDPRWNCMNSIMTLEVSLAYFSPESIAEAQARPAIRHYEGPSSNKPWNFLADRREQARYERYRAETPWPNVEFDDRTMATRLLHPLPASLRLRAYRRLLYRRLGRK